MSTETATETLTVLHVGCGRKRTLDAIGLRLGYPDGRPFPGAVTLINLDMRPCVEPDVLCELGKDRIDLPDDSIDAVVALHVLEHIGIQGQLQAWFYAWEELYRVLKPGGVVSFECPYHSSVWAWADPTHTRAISEHTFLYLNQDAYLAPGSAIPDYRPPFDFVWGHWTLRGDTTNVEVAAREGDRTFIAGTLVARKPLRPYWEQ